MVSPNFARKKNTEDDGAYQKCRIAAMLRRCVRHKSLLLDGGKEVGELASIFFIFI